MRKMRRQTQPSGLARSRCTLPTFHTYARVFGQPNSGALLLDPFSSSQLTKPLCDRWHICVLGWFVGFAILTVL